MLMAAVTSIGQPGAERFLTGVPALQQRHHAGERGGPDDGAGHRGGEEDAPGARAGAADRRERARSPAAPAEVAARGLRDVEPQLGRHRPGE